MKYLFLILSLLSVSNFTAQTLVKNKSSQSIKKVRKSNNIDMNRLNLENKVVGKTALPVLYRFKEDKLILNGAGLRELLWVDVYACGLYVKSPEIDDRKLIEKNELAIFRMDILSKAVSQNKLIKAFYKGFESGNSEAAFIRLSPQIDQFVKYLEGLNLKIGDKIDIVYEPNVGVSMYSNYKKLGTVGNLDFKQALWNIWLSKDPVDKSLKTELLNGAREFLKD